MNRHLKGRRRGQEMLINQSGPWAILSWIFSPFYLYALFPPTRL